VDHSDGTVTLSVIRRVGAAEGSWETIECRGTDQAECERAYDAECVRRAELSAAQGRRRERWGVW